jgi:tetratricopeptide (TPR) repeat protein
VNIKREKYDEATEYISRVLYLDPNHVKALSRQAFLLSESGELKAALMSAEKALSLDAENKELIVQVDELRAAVISKEEEERVKALLDG